MILCFPRAGNGLRPGVNQVLTAEARGPAEGDLEAGAPHLMARPMADPSDHFLARSFQALQENVRRAGPAAAAGYTLIGAILLLGGVGHLVDRWAATSPWFLLTGLLVGLVVGFYELAKTVWKT